MNKVKYIDPMIGTVGDEQQTSMHGGGKTYPGVSLPGGMVQVSPDTVTGGDNGTGYNYCQNTIEGFSFNHMSGIGWYGDLGNLQIMPVIGETDLRSGSNEEIPFVKGGEGWKSAFSHEKETARVGYYSVELLKYNILAEATATLRTGLLRFTYPAAKDAGLIFNFSRRIGGRADFQHVDIIDDTHMEGYIRCTPAGGGFGRGEGGIGYTFYFTLEISKPLKDRKFFSCEEYEAEGLTSYEGEDVGLVAHFEAEEGEQVVIKCGISYTDLDGARKNFKEEYTEFDTAVKNAAQAWEEAFSCVNVKGENETDLTLFYTCLYHALLDPRTSMDCDGRFRAANGNVLKADYVHRTMFSGWDVYRSEFPLLTLIRPDIVNDEINSLLSIAIENNSSLPRWELMGIDSGCMVGDPGQLVYADAYMKGIRGFNLEKAYEIAIASAKAADTLNEKPFKSFRPKTKEYLENAYVAEKLSDTLEYLLADFVMYKVAESMGKTEDAAFFKSRADRYSDNFNPETGFMGPRKADGGFIPVEHEYVETGCVESNIFQQSWFVPFDVEGLSKLFGQERFVELLEKFFCKADLSALWNEDYNHSNEPCHNITHYFSMLGLPHRTQYWTRRVQKEAYRLGAFGFCGNEDVGQLSGWYVLSALGFAQVCPAVPEYYLNTPLFKEAQIRLNPMYHSCVVSEQFEIKCDKDPLEFPYIKEVYLNDRKVDRSYLTYEEITAGGILKLILSRDSE